MVSFFFASYDSSGIGILLESRIITFDIFFIFILSQVESLNPILTGIGHYAQLFSILFWCLLPLYLTLYNIYQCEGTLSIQFRRKLTKESSLKSMDTINDEENKNTETNENKNTETNENKENQTDIESELSQPLHLFLEKYENYKLFAQYLGYCFAIENLLFLERVCIFTQIVNKFKEEQIDLDSDDNGVEIDLGSSNDPTSRPTLDERIRSISLSKQECQNVPQIHLSFLNGVYEELNTLIQDNLPKTGDNTVRNCTYYKPGLDVVIEMMCKQFIFPDAPNEINIPADDRELIISLVSEIHGMNNFTQYVHLFDGALIEIYGLLLSLYSYRFKSYIRNHIKE